MASLIPGYEYDIFISYRQKDNKHDGWVTEFVENLKGELESTFKEEISVYFDINPHDGLLETHDVDASLQDKLKCLIFIPIISRTYCDPNSFAWEHEFKAFVQKASHDQLGLKVKLANGNVSSRVLPIRIHELNPQDNKLVETYLGFIRSVDFVYHSQGVNRPLRKKDDDVIQGTKQFIYRDQINKVSNAIEEIIQSIKVMHSIPTKREIIDKEDTERKETETIRIYRKEGIYTDSEVQSEIPRPVRLKKLHRTRSNLALAMIALFLGVLCIKLYTDQNKRKFARNVLIPQIQKLIEENPTPPARAFELATEAKKYISSDSVLSKLYSRISDTISLQTQPENAKVSWKDYDKPDDPWKEIGRTPFRNKRVPLSYLRIKIEKEGYQTVFLTSFNLIESGVPLKLDSMGNLPKNMVRIPSGTTNMIIVGFEKSVPHRVEEFLADRYEVTNQEYNQFIDDGGYNNTKYWKYPIYSEGKEISWDSAMNRFVDNTGKQAPASWEVGKYPDGQDEYPVAGISWYEASAFAAWAGKILPTIYHWSLIAETSRSMYIIPLSNYNANSAVRIGTMEGISSYGIYDLAGNVREWCYNGTAVNGASLTLGGGWNDPAYSFNEPGLQPSIDRSLSNGFRCIKLLPEDTTFNFLSGPVINESRNYLVEKPVDDNTFSIFLKQFSYDKLPLNEQIIAKSDTGIWKVEKIVMDAAYNKEKLIVYLFIPKDAQPPYQPILFFPGSDAIRTDKINNYAIQRVDFIVKSGRVLVLPVLKSTFERRDGLPYTDQAPTVSYKDHVIMWRKDIGRTIDYLETRSDMRSDKIGFFGLSWGGRMGGTMAAIEPRLKAIVLNVGGLNMSKALPEVDNLNFLPRVRQPVLMLNGKYDEYFPVETSQKPMFNFLGTPTKDKKMLIYDTGHLVPRTELIKETLSWYDKYLGHVNTP